MYRKKLVEIVSLLILAIALVGATWNITPQSSTYSRHEVLIVDVVTG